MKPGRRERAERAVVLVDSSIWIGVEHGRFDLTSLVADGRTATCPVAIMEVLRGTRDARRYDKALAMLMSFELLDVPTPLERFEQAARLYLQCRAGGVTPSTADCLIAACAIAHDIPLLHDDADFEHIARFTSLKTVTRS